jgi:1,4-dihydroxy-6-naphthoate synthase
MAYNIDEAVDYSMKYGRGQSKDVITKFIKMYVNDLTVDMGESGKKSIERIFLMASTKGMLKANSMSFSG